MKRLMFAIAAGVGMLVLGGGVLLYVNKERIARYGTDRALNAVESQLTVHLAGASLRDSAKADFTALHRRLQEGSIGAGEVREFAALFYISARDEQIDSTEVRTLLTRLHALAHSALPPP